jgi:Ca2+-binding RTX toxin-like protein
VDGLIGSLTLNAGCDNLDGGAGNDTLIGDQLLGVGTVLNAIGVLPAVIPTGEVLLDIHELVDCLDAKAGRDKLTGGAGDDLMIGGSQSVVAAYLGSLTTPLAAAIKIIGDRLVDGFDVRADCDTLRGGDGNDTLVGDSDTTVLLLVNGGAAPAGSYGMTRLAQRLTVAANGGDELKGDAGTDLVEPGNRAIAPAILIKTASISSLSKTNPPAAVPEIDWQGQLCDKGNTRWGRANWVQDFVNGLGQSGG